MSAPPPNARDAAIARGWTPTTWLAAGHSIDPYIDSSAGGYWTANPYVSSAQPPATVVSASAPRPPPLRESAHILPTGLFASNTIANSILQRWLAPVEARRAPAATPLLVVGRSAWDAVHSAVAASAGSYPNNYRFLPAAELPRDETSLMLLRANANKPIISVALPSVASAAALAPAVRNLQAKMPQHSWCFFAPSPSPEGIPQLPAAVRDAFSVITWADSRADLVTEVAASHAAADVQRTAGDALRTIEASFLRVGGTPQLGLTPGQRLGLEPTPYRDAAVAALAAETRAKAAYWAKMEGDVRDTKRVRLTDFNRGAGIVSTKDNAHFGAHTRA